jgi:AcrR family transcriptional regulator
MASRRTFDTSTWPTRERILLHASKLFASKGFHGTSTRDIAAAVGIRQPTVYSHFASKQAIAAELLHRDLSLGIAALEQLAAEGGGPAVELYRYLVWEVSYVRSTPFDLRALYLGDILDLPEFRDGRRLDTTYTARLGSIIERGMASGVFAPGDVTFARQVVEAIEMETIRGAGRRRRSRILDEPDLVASFVLRALLRQPGRLGAVRTAAGTRGPLVVST